VETEWGPKAGCERVRGGVIHESSGNGDEERLDPERGLGLK